MFSISLKHYEKHMEVATSDWFKHCSGGTTVYSPKNCQNRTGFPSIGTSKLIFLSLSFSLGLLRSLIPCRVSKIIYVLLCKFSYITTHHLLPWVVKVTSDPARLLLVTSLYHHVQSSNYSTGWKSAAKMSPSAAFLLSQTHQVGISRQPVIGLCVLIL